VCDLEQGGMLPPHTDDGPDAWNKKNGPDHLAYRLELVESPKNLAEHLAMGAGKRYRSEFFSTKIIVQVPDEGPNGLFHPAHVPHVRVFPDKPPSAVDNNAVDTHRTGVYPCVESIPAVFICHSPFLKNISFVPGITCPLENRLKAVLYPL